MNKIWIPITVRNLIEKFKKIKPQPDRIKKLHLREKGTLHIFAKLCNLFMLHRIYPVQWKTNRTKTYPQTGEKRGKG